MLASVRPIGLARVGSGYLSEISWLMSFRTWLGAAKIGHGLSSSILSRSFLKLMLLAPNACTFMEMLYLARYCSTLGLVSLIFLISAYRTFSPLSYIIWSRIFSNSVLRWMLMSLWKMSCKKGQMYILTSAFLIKSSLFSMMNSISGSLGSRTSSPKIVVNRNCGLLLAIYSKISLIKTFFSLSFKKIVWMICFRPLFLVRIPLWIMIFNNYE